MSTNASPDPAGAPAAPEAPPAAVPTPDPSISAAPPMPPAPPAPLTPPAPPAPAAPPGPSAAEAFYADFANPQSRGEALIKHGRQWGIVPAGIESPDELGRALSMYDEWKRGQPPTPPAAGGVPPAPETPGSSFDDQGYIDPDQFRQQVVGDVMQAMEQREQQRQIQQEQQARLGNLQSAVGSIAEREKFDPATHEMLLRNVAIGIDAAIEAGRQVDFSPEALGRYAEDVLTALRGLGASAAVAAQQQQIGQHRSMAPMTTAPTGPAAAGTPGGGTRGVAGVVERARAAAAAEGGV